MPPPPSSCAPAWSRPSDAAALRSQAQRWLAGDTPAVIVEVAEIRGSTPREVGARMLVCAGARESDGGAGWGAGPGARVATAGMAGTIGGGHLEHVALHEARELLQAASTRPAALPALPVERRYPLGPTLGQCCGGTVLLRYTLLDQAALDAWPAGPARLPVLLFGAGHVGRALAAALAPLPFVLRWIDEREDAFPDDPAWFAAHPHIERVCVDAVEAEVAIATPGSAFVVMTHSHDLDLSIVQAILRRGDAAFCGLIGSQTKRQRFLHRLADRGLPPERLAQLTCPIGLPAIPGKEPEVIAASVAAQLLHLRNAQQG
ncbi:MAG: xanthine dehydrogenase accessory protein XdhC [Aquabacterium sp.]|nr:xanthine dehydrogenase accessory protein XdhC [Aquabacterium sp.]